MLLSALDPAWGAALSVAWAVIAQGISGVAKDITKTASKSAIKATSEGGNGQLFKWVAWFTGSKNAMKGFGFFAGGLLLQLVGFKPALWLMAAMLACGADRRADEPAARARQGESLEELCRAVRQIARDQSAGRRAHLPVRCARCVVRRRPAGFPLRAGLEISPPWPASSPPGRSATVSFRASPRWSCAQRRRAVARDPGSAPVGRDPDRNSGRACAPAASRLCRSARVCSW